MVFASYISCFPTKNVNSTQVIEPNNATGIATETEVGDSQDAANDDLDKANSFWGCCGGWGPGWGGGWGGYGGWVAYSGWGVRRSGWEGGWGGFWG